MDDRKHGNADLGDCVASKKMLTDTGWADPARIGIASSARSPCGPPPYGCSRFGDPAPRDMVGGEGTEWK